MSAADQPGKLQEGQGSRAGGQNTETQDTLGGFRASLCQLGHSGHRCAARGETFGEEGLGGPGQVRGAPPARAEDDYPTWLSAWLFQDPHRQGLSPSPPPAAWPGSGQMVSRGPQDTEFIPKGSPQT